MPLNPIKCETEHRLEDIPREDGRVSHNDVRDVKAHLLLPKNTDVREFMERLFAEHEEILFWSTNHYDSGAKGD